MYPFKTVITTVKMAKSKLHPTFIRAHVYPGTAGTCNFYPAPRKRGKGTSTIIAPHTRSGERQKHELLVTGLPQRKKHIQRAACAGESRTLRILSKVHCAEESQIILSLIT